MRIKEFITAVSTLGDGPYLYFGETGLDCSGCPIEEMLLTIIIDPTGFLGGCRIVGRGTWKTLQDNINRLIEGKRMNLRLESNPPKGNPQGWYIFGTDVLDIRKDSRWVISGGCAGQDC